MKKQIITRFLCSDIKYDLEDTFEHIKTRLDDYVKDNPDYFNFRLDIDYEFENIQLRVRADRYETDEEFNTRKELLKKDRKQKQVRKQKRIEQEKKLYEKLKKKYD